MQFNISFDTANSPDLASLSAGEQQALLDTANAAATIWSWYLGGADVTLDLSIAVDESLFSGTVLAEGGPETFYTTGGTFSGQAIYESDTSVELRTGLDRNGSQPDLHMGLTVHSIRDLLYFKTDPYAPVPAGDNDALSVFLHEIGHGLGIVYAGDDPDFAGVTVYDTFVRNNTFIGSNAEAAYRALLGNPSGPLQPLPLEPGSLSHLSENGALGPDLMSPGLPTGVNVGISAVDLGILQDIGLAIRQPTAGDDVLHAVYGVELHLGAGNDTGYAVGKGSTIFGENGDDQLTGERGNDFFYGGNGDDYLQGAAGNDRLEGDADDDTLVGGAGDDQLLGDGGMDTARYSGLVSDYQITQLGFNNIQIKDLRPGSPDGTDTLGGVERVLWSDGNLSIFNSPPVVTTTSRALQKNQSVSLSGLFSVSDPDGDAITSYQIWDGTDDPASGHFVVNGVAKSARQVIDISAFDLAQTFFVGGTVTDNLQIRASDGNGWSAPSAGAWSAFTVFFANTPPVVTTSRVTALPSTALALSSLVSASDSDGDAITRYQLWDGVADPASGHFVVNGVVQPERSVIDITAAQLAQTSFITGSTADDNLQIRAFDGTDWSAGASAAWAPFTVALALYRAPSMATSNWRVSRNQFIDLRGIIAAQPYAGYSITAYQLLDTTTDPLSGYFVVGGVAQPAGTEIDLTPAQFATATFVTGKVSDNLQARAFDGTSWSAPDHAPWSPFTLIAPANTAPVVTVGTKTSGGTFTSIGTATASRGQTLNLSDYTLFYDADGDAPVFYQVWDATLDPNHGSIVVNGVTRPDGVNSLTPAEFAQTTFVAGKINDLIQIRAFDGLDWSSTSGTSWSPLTVTVPSNHAPVLTTANIAATLHGQSLALNTLFSVSDSDADAITRYQLWDGTTDPNSGHFVINGAVQAGRSIIDITASQLGQTSFVTGVVGDALQIRAFDGVSWSAPDNGAWSPFTITPPINHAPVVTTANVSVVHGQTVSLSSLFSVSDADSDTIIKYQLFDGTVDPNSGHFVVNGFAALPARQVIDVFASELSLYTFVAGASASDGLQIRAFDGTDWSAADNAPWAPFTIGLPVNHAPVVATANLSAGHGQSISLSSLFSANDIDGDSMTRYQIWDGTTDPNSGHFVVNGFAALPARQVIDVFASELSLYTFVAGASAPDALQIRAYDGAAWSAPDNGAWSPFTVTVPVNHAPVVATAPVAASHSQSFALSSLITASDPDNDSITRYQLWDATDDPGSGHFVINGVAQPERSIIDITAAQVAQTSFVSGIISDTLHIRAYDGFAWSAPDNGAWSPFTVTVPANHAPVLTTTDRTLTHNQSQTLSSLITVNDADGDSITAYQLWDSTADPGSGHFVINGVAQAERSIIDITASQLAQTMFVTGNLGLGGDTLQVRAFDGFAWSAPDNGAWAPFHINVT